MTNRQLPLPAQSRAQDNRSEKESIVGVQKQEDSFFQFWNKFYSHVDVDYYGIYFEIFGENEYRNVMEIAMAR